MVLCVANTQQSSGRTPEEEAAARRIRRTFPSAEIDRKGTQRGGGQARNAGARQTEAEEKKTRLTELRKRLNLTGAEATANKTKAAQIQKQIEDLMLQIEALVKQMPPIRKEIEELKKQLALLNNWGVQLVFDGKVILGTRARKTRTKSFNAFSSIDYPDTAEFRDLRRFVSCRARRAMDRSAFMKNWTRRCLCCG